MVIDFKIIKNIYRRFSGKVLMIELKATRKIFAMKVIMKRTLTGCRQRSTSSRRLPIPLS